MTIEANPLETGGNVQVMRVETLADATPITADAFAKLLAQLTALESNDDRLAELENAKTPYLFTSDQLTALLELTPSVKTRLAFIGMLGPRLTDPRAKISYFTGLFRYTEEKAQVEEVLKNRVTTLSAAAFTRGDGLKTLGGRGGRGGGGPLGAPGRGRGGGRSGSANVTPASSRSETELIAPGGSIGVMAYLAGGSADSAGEGAGRLGLSVPSTPPPGPAMLSPDFRSARSVSDDEGLDSFSPAIHNMEEVLSALDSMGGGSRPVSMHKRGAAPVMAAIDEDGDGDGDGDGDDGSERSTPAHVRADDDGEGVTDRPETLSPRTDVETSGEGGLSPPLDRRDGKAAISTRLFEAGMIDPVNATSAIPPPISSPLGRPPSFRLDSVFGAALPEETASSRTSQAPHTLHRPPSRRSLTMDDMGIGKGSAATQDLLLDALTDPPAVLHPLPAAREVSPAPVHTAALEPRHRDSGAAAGLHKGATSIRLATVAATPSAPLLPTAQQDAPAVAKTLGSAKPLKAAPAPSTSLLPASHIQPKSRLGEGAGTATSAPQRRRSDAGGGVVRSDSGVVVPATPPVALGIKPSAPQFLDPPARCAQLVHMSRDDFLALAPLPPPEEGGCLPYAELLRRNLHKDYEGGIRGGELETYLSEAEFVKVFQKTKTEFYQQVRWKQVEQKKKAMLF